jgi:heme exporter protein A
MKRRLALARLLLRPPAVLLLDEPYASFDADGIHLVNAFAVEIASNGGAVIVATHDLTRGIAILQRYVEMADGRLQPVEVARAPEAAAGSRVEDAL